LLHSTCPPRALRPKQNELLRKQKRRRQDQEDADKKTLDAQFKRCGGSSLSTSGLRQPAPVATRVASCSGVQEDADSLVVQMVGDVCGSGDLGQPLWTPGMKLFDPGTKKKTEMHIICQRCNVLSCEMRRQRKNSDEETGPEGGKIAEKG
jgi:hypothetical protein